MSAPIRGKINLVLQKAVPGTVLTMKWLVQQGVSKDLAQKYVASGWLERIGRGAYVRTGDTVDWEGAVFSLQTQVGLNVHVAALSSLQLKGLAHFLPVGMGLESHIMLFSDGFERLPDWFLKKDWNVSVEHRCTNLFANAKRLLLSDVQCRGFSIQASSPERGAFELLYKIQTNTDFDYARTLFQGFTNFRPAAVQKLLDACGSVRVKRIFLWMAKMYGHPWLKYVDLEDVSLGSGKRVVYQGGMLDREFLITVPKKEESADV